MSPRFLKSSPIHLVRRTEHGGTAWSLGEDLRAEYQPQDGAPIAPRNVSDIGSLLQRSFREPEDARITGGTRSLMRRLLALNRPKAAA